MWVMTLDGFYSAVESKDDPSCLTVRCRMEQDAERLADAVGRTVEHTPDRDYHWRVLVPRSAWGEYLTTVARTIDYDNFKHEVGVRQGRRRADVYGEVWADLLSLQYDPEFSRRTV
jgi:hypothetical protein